MRLEILLSCMYQKDIALVEKSHITSDVLIINQANENIMIERNENNQRVRMITTTERGLSRSRNKAIENAQGDICMLCDDDEVFENRYEQMIIDAFLAKPDADIIAFNIVNKETRLKPVIQRVGYLKSLKIASCQIAFRRKRIVENNVRFDVLMGAGSGNGCSEENKFLWDCLRKNIKIYYSPLTVAKLQESDSTWFLGYDDQFFYQRGAATRYMMGMILAILYGGYYLLCKRKLYSSTISTPKACRALLRGIWDNPIKSQMM